eukprot:SAG11_NODE_6239_length_1355_cov_2.410828_1_plen_60_part_10
MQQHAWAATDDAQDMVDALDAKAVFADALAEQAEVRKQRCALRRRVLSGSGQWRLWRGRG